MASSIFKEGLTRNNRAAINEASPSRRPFQLGRIISDTLTSEIGTKVRYWLAFLFFFEFLAFLGLLQSSTAHVNSVLSILPLLWRFRTDIARTLRRQYVQLPVSSDWLGFPPVPPPSPIERIPDQAYRRRPLVLPEFDASTFPVYAITPTCPDSADVTGTSKVETRKTLLEATASKVNVPLLQKELAPAEPQFHEPVLELASNDMEVDSRSDMDMSLPTQAAVSNYGPEENENSVCPSYLDPQKSNVLTVTGDGSCLFRALAQGVYHLWNDGFLPLPEETKAGEELRSIVIGILSSPISSDRIRDVILTLRTSLQAYVEKISIGTYWGGEREIAILAEYLHQPITVYIGREINGERTLMRIRSYGTDYATENKPIRLLFEDGNHYNLIVD